MKKTIFINGSEMSVEDFSKAHNLTVRGGLYLRGCGIKKLPENIFVDGDLYLDIRVERVETLPKGLTVCGELDLYRTAIKKIPNNIRIDGDLYMPGTIIVSRPETLSVGGFLCMVLKLWRRRRRR